MSARKELLKYLADNQAIEKGVVLRVNQNTILVSSSTGMKEFPINGVLFKSGDKVRFRGDTYLGKIRTNSNPTIYSV